MLHALPLFRMRDSGGRKRDSPLLRVVLTSMGGRARKALRLMTLAAARVRFCARTDLRLAPSDTLPMTCTAAHTSSKELPCTWSCCEP